VEIFVPFKVQNTQNRLSYTKYEVPYPISIFDGEFSNNFILNRTSTRGADDVIQCNALESFVSFHIYSNPRI
jgi:hypothetical protein